MATLRIALLALAGLLSAGCLGAGVAPPEAPSEAEGAGRAFLTSFTTAGSCHEVAYTIPIDAARARAVVPEGFEPLVAAGRGLLGVFAESCTASVEDGPASPSVVTGIFVFLDRARSRADCQFYAVQWTSSREDEWNGAYNEVGWVMPVADAAYAIAGALPVTQVEMALRETPAPWTAHARASPTAREPTPSVSVHCYLGERGLVRGTYSHDPIEVAGAIVDATLGDGETWETLGASSGTFPGLLGRFDWTGLTEVVEFAPWLSPAKAQAGAGRVQLVRPQLVALALTSALVLAG